VAEWSPDLLACGSAVGALVARASGAALFLDYGPCKPQTCGDTLQAVRGHGKEDPLAHPGEADLTAHVRFALFLAAARAAGARTPPPLTQADFLRALGIDIRAAKLARTRPDQAEKVSRQLARLVGPDQMGLLFKAACIHSRDIAPPPFEVVA
jgi:SAM-dependent MidA family methyltransferase